MLQSSVGEVLGANRCGGMKLKCFSRGKWEDSQTAREIAKQHELLKQHREPLSPDVSRLPSRPILPRSLSAILSDLQHNATSLFRLQNPTSVFVHITQRSFG